MFCLNKLQFCYTSWIN